ncbi:hypothetical protein GQ42DRAFT_7983 [Ramicandelaber brevisporus]|nr:hypothetical protein GQ42DRAFT_7983 [Ramicandelaber brevisporus]
MSSCVCGRRLHSTRHSRQQHGLISIDRTLQDHVYSIESVFAFKQRHTNHAARRAIALPPCEGDSALGLLQPECTAMNSDRPHSRAVRGCARSLTASIPLLSLLLLFHYSFLLLFSSSWSVLHLAQTMLAGSLVHSSSNVG